MADYSKMNLEQLTKLHRKKREEMAALREEMDVIEERIAPLSALKSALKKMQSIGFSPAEMKAMGVEPDAKVANPGSAKGNRVKSGKSARQRGNKSKR